MPGPTAAAIDGEPVAAPSATEVEALNSATFRQAVRARDVIERRAELLLVYAFRDWLAEAKGIAATGLGIPYVAEGRNLRADLFVPAHPLLIEAKSSATCESLRLAIGQLFDYRRWLDPEPRVAVLVLSPPEILARFRIRPA